MSLDGSFCCKSSLDRFLARCPKLQSNPTFSELALKVDKMVEEEVVYALAEPFLHPNYTIPLIGCFRPLVRRIVDQMVSLLRPSLGLRMDSDCVTSSDISDEDVNVVEFYLKNRRCLKLHELASLALCRALDLAPFILRSVVQYFSFAPPPFQRLSLMGSSLTLPEQDQIHLVHICWVSYRFLHMDSEVFSELWNWSCFVDLVQQCSINSCSGPEFLKNVLDLKWCGVQILAALLRISDRATANFGLSAKCANTCFLRWQDFCQDVSLEKVGCYLEANEPEIGGFLQDKYDSSLAFFLQSADVRSPVTSYHFCQVELLRKNRKKAECVKAAESPFVITSAVEKSLRMVFLAVNQRWPVLLLGPTGSGKTALINKLSQYGGNQVIFLHMDEQMDGKTLIGSYTCLEQPGEFRWQPGSLTQAVTNGLWVVFEDIDKASSEVLSILLPLLEGASSFVTGRGEEIIVDVGFQLFATVSSPEHDLHRTIEARNSFSSLWRKVLVTNPSCEDMLKIVYAWYPCAQLQFLAEELKATFEMVNCFGGWPGSCNAFSRFSLRDLLKWCKRIAGLGFDFSKHALSTSVCRSIYQEAVDIFASSLASSISRISLMKEIAKIWHIPPSEIEHIYPSNKPVIQTSQTHLQVGRAILERTPSMACNQTHIFVDIHSSVHVLERIACSVKYNEPVLLVGETGTGKTTLVQNLALRLGRPLTVLNMSQQSDVADLLGGYKPIDERMVCIGLHREFKHLVCKTFLPTDKVYDDIVRKLDLYAMKKEWKKLLHGFRKVVNGVFKKVSDTEEAGSGIKRKRAGKVMRSWELFSKRIEAAHNQLHDSGFMLFSFVEGAFITSLKNGHWILLDEVNLAPPETLQRIIGVLEGENGSLCLAERGDMDYINRDSQFRIFACMNPPTDAGKRDLPYSLRTRFTEIFVDEMLDREELILYIRKFLDVDLINRELLEKIANFYINAKKESENRLQDGANQKPQFSLRSLTRALEYVLKAKGHFGFERALYDGFCMFFLTLLDAPSAKLMNNMIVSYLFGGKIPMDVPFDRYLMKQKSQEFSSSDVFLEKYVLTKSIKEHLRNLSRAVFIKRYPVLLQGPTSSGKTSLVQYLASITGHEFVRINNHEHTDLQEYFGSYVTDSYGKLTFQEGVLVKAVRYGYWIVLDELNLAPSDVLEALNRLLDDNRELFVPELQETLPAHPDFMLFATQNPPLYGGRKMLSRAFRNRFLEIQVDEIPEDELSIILEKRCQIPKSYALKMVDVMKELQLHRQSSKVFAGKHGFITPRDLFRWADRFRSFGRSYEDLARDGYFLLAERLRDEREKLVVQEVLEKHLRVKLFEGDLYNQDMEQANSLSDICRLSAVQGNLGNIIWTKSLWRLYFLLERCYKLREPVLLVGETGGGKTTVCQLLSIVIGARLHTLNCHMYTETSDFLGGFYPVRDRSRLAMEFKYHFERLKQSKIFLHFQGMTIVSSDIEHASSTLDHLNKILDDYRQGTISHPDVGPEDTDSFEQVKLELQQLHHKWQTLFSWLDGPLVRAMKDGDLLLVDEISLAEDSVLERLNSVLEPERRLSLAEKGGSELEKITAHPGFFLLATMNPGGDYGKKELSPALRNRFTEIWVSPVSDIDELRSIAAQRLIKSDLSHIVDAMINFWEWFNQLQTGRTVTVRDLLSWVSFINATERSLGNEHAFIHGAFLVLLDGLSLGTSISKHEAKRLQERCFLFLLEQLQAGISGKIDLHFYKMENFGWGDIGKNSNLNCNNGQSEHIFGMNPFFITKGDKDCKHDGFQFFAPTTRRNALRVLRALQLSKPVLLEGSPGVGKTSLVVALAEYSGHMIVRINLSEQTDIMDLLGSDLPVECEKGMKFAWSDGILLQALKSGSWVLLDELNLAPQSVLEGLNAILDHRAEVYIPELGQSFKCPPSFRVFACQNPSCQGGGRKGLPKSFLNRFTKVYVDELVEIDYFSICKSRFPLIPEDTLLKLIHFNKKLYEDTMLFCKFGQNGSPWEFNLRDVIRSCEIIERATDSSKIYSFLNTLFIQKMRTVNDRKEVIRLFREVFGEEVKKPFINGYPRVQINPQHLIVGTAIFERNHFQPTKFLKGQIHILPGICQSLEAALQCIQHQWLCILVGPSSSGKTSLIRLLAQLTGNKLNEINLSSGTDISELLGCFEQYSAYRTFHSVITRVECFFNECSSLCLEASAKEFLTNKKALVKRWLDFMSSISRNKSLVFDSEIMDVDKLIEIIEDLKLVMARYHLAASWSDKELNECLNIILKLQERNRKGSFWPKFEWVSGGLLKAVEHGEWVLLKNANLCSPTVLDRINSLFEPSRSIIVNECGLIDGKPAILHAHPKFRVFLTVDPRYGEISRAMRNRGVEIFMMQPYYSLDEDVGIGDHTEAEIADVRRFLILSGIPSRKLVDEMAKAHLCARDAGLHFGIRITLLELTRWVQLFQHLIMNGNRPTWSLLLSWEHTYLSSLGQVDGSKIIDHVKSSLANSGSSILYTLPECSPSLPGGWPSPIRLKNFVSHSMETSIKQNLMYLEFLGTQCASFCAVSGRNSESLHLSYSSISYTGMSLLENSSRVKPSVIPMQMLHGVLFPQNLVGKSPHSSDPPEFDLALANKMLFFAANWTIEQSSESDLASYLLWFEWYNAQLQPYCCFFASFLSTLEQERNHPIWNFIYNCRRDIISYNHIDINKQPVPLLSLELLKLDASNDELLICRKHLDNAIQAVSLLRLSIQQWNIEHVYASGEEQTHYWLLPMLKCLRQLEEKVLYLIVESPHFNSLLKLYTDLLEHHTWFWRCITQITSEFLPVSWYYLKKKALKFHIFCVNQVDSLMDASRNVYNLPPWSFHSTKSLLWSYGGHPVLPSSASLYTMVQKLLKLTEMLWPATSKAVVPIARMNHIGMVASANSELRHLAMEGICMSMCLAIKGYGHQEDSAVHKLEEVHEMLAKKFEYEKHNLKEMFAAKSSDCFSEMSMCSCCAFLPEMLCTKQGLHSWLETLPLVDRKSHLLDMELLEKLAKRILVDAEDFYEVLSNLSDLLRYAMNFSLDYSSRLPTDFLPHQKLLWLLGAWSSVDCVSTEVASYVHEMWFKWHSSQWMYCLKLFENFPHAGHTTRHACIPFHPTMVATLQQIFQHSLPIVDYPSHRLKFRVVSGLLWQDSPLKRDVVTSLFSIAKSLFKQIIFAHKRSFEEGIFGQIKSIFCSIEDRSCTQETLKTLKSLIMSSNHVGLTSLVDCYIDPLLNELYCRHPSLDDLRALSKAWIYIGGLRFHLLLSLDKFDPAKKYEFKYAQLQEKISLLELEIKVREECCHLAGRNSTIDDQKRRKDLLQMLVMEQDKLQNKIVFRPKPDKFNKLKSTWTEFLESVASSVRLASNLEQENMDIRLRKESIEKASNWQVISARFIDQLAEEFAAYVDLIQPVQVAIYEIKLGLSVSMACALQKAYLHEVKDSVEPIMETIHSFLQFPRRWTVHVICVEPKTMLPVLHSPSMDCPNRTLDEERNLLKRLFNASRDANSTKAAPILQVDATIYQIRLVRVAHRVFSSMLMDNASLQLLSEIFDQVASLWVEMKVHMKAKENEEAQMYRFRPRKFRTEDMIEVDMSSLAEFVSDESLSSEWQEVMQAPSIEKENLEEDWSHIQDSILKSMVHIHNQLFGSNMLWNVPGLLVAHYENDLQSFMDAYKLGMKMIEAMPPQLSFKVDTNLMPEHLFHLCEEYKRKFTPLHKSTHGYNFYKDSNAPALARMVEPLSILQNKVVTFLDEWPEHPGLQNILNIIKMLLGLPMDMPLAKALLALQFLLSKTMALQENVPKFSFSDVLQPIFSQVTSWQKLELESWPSLLDGVIEKYDANAEKLWFPLYSVLHREYMGDGDHQYTIQSLLEFIQTASVGELKKRLELLLAFYGHFSSCMHLKAHSSPRAKEVLRVLYNVLGYSMQFLPLVSELIENNRRSAEKELKEVAKLSQWELRQSYLSIENSKRTRQKILKLIQKFNDTLQQPVMDVLTQEEMNKRMKLTNLVQAAPINDTIDTNAEPLMKVIGVTRFSSAERAFHHGGWRKRVDSALQKLNYEFNFPCFPLKDCKGVSDLIRQSFSSVYTDQIYLEGWTSLEDIYRVVTDCTCLWKHGTKNPKKRRALADLFEMLERCGLSKHKSAVFEMELQSNHLVSWFDQPFYDVQHSLQPLKGSFFGNVKIPTPDDSDWEVASLYYYKNLAMMQELQQIRLNFHKHLTLEQVNRSGSFLNHLMVIQQDQRSVAYSFWYQMKKLRKYISSLRECDQGAETECSITPNQNAVHKSMWQQKQLFDAYCSMLNDVSYLVRTVENTHIDTCNRINSEANIVSNFINKFVPVFQKSKESLDRHLLGSNGIITPTTGCTPLFVVSKQMEQLVIENFALMNDFEDSFQKLYLEAFQRISLGETLLNRFRDMIEWGKLILEEYNSELKHDEQQLTVTEVGSSVENLSELKALFTDAYEEIVREVLGAFERLGLYNNEHSTLEFSKESLSGNIPSWKVPFESCLEALQLKSICGILERTLLSARKVVNIGGRGQSNICLQVQGSLKQLYVLMEILQTFADGFLHELLALHKTVAELTYMLANMFALLYSIGFGTTEDETDGSCSATQPASGTGMGEGEGVNDVSDQIDDEDQLLGTSQKDGEQQDASNDVPSKTGKGIEMEQDFDADTFSVSGDSGNDSHDESGEEEEDANIDSVMGEAGDNKEVVDEKLWDKDEDGNHDVDSIEKYESGSSVKETDPSSREVRAKDDHAPDMDDSEVQKSDEMDSDNEENPCLDGNNNESNDEMKLDKESAFEDTSGVQLNDEKQSLEDMNVDGDSAETDTLEEGSDPTETDMDGDNGETDDVDDPMDTTDPAEEEGNAENDDPGKEGAERSDTVTGTNDNEFMEPQMDSTDDSRLNLNSALVNEKNFTAETSLAPQTFMSNSTDLQHTCPSRDLPSGDLPDVGMNLPISGKGGKSSSEQPKVHSPQRDNLPAERMHSNPYRSIGDALEEWKERAKISSDVPQDHKSDPPDVFEGDDADEYEFISRLENSTSQALGPAASDQTAKNVKSSKPDADEDMGDDKQDNEAVEGNIEDSKMQHYGHHTAAPQQKSDNKMQGQLDDCDESVEEDLVEVDEQPSNQAGDLVLINNNLMDDQISKLGGLSKVNEQLGEVQKIEVSDDMIDGNATAIWRKHDMMTTRLSQELAEQLRLVMEPTVASKLQGDYRTGKRINMKKVIPYIASHYRKDKIWLRRTRLNKRDYQVVVAIDDSRSMSESQCGDVAVEALITVCRAMSQLEVGQLAAVSFGAQGNVRLLQGFDQPFTGEAGIKMIASLAFKQENTIADEPMVNLLRVLNGMLDTAVANARLPTGQNPLQQLILIIADGRFHEKESLKRCIRDALSKKRMIAFVLLDSPQESIMDLQEATFQGGQLSFSKYLNSFPFPHYVVLKNIEALPRTLADLLRQWFELMQTSDD